MDKRYISFDVEASGPSPGKYSMLSLGACIVGDRNVQFYREIKPISANFIHGNMQIGCLGLHCLRPLVHMKEFNPKSSKFDPKKVLEVLMEKGETPAAVMSAYGDWISEHSKGFRPIEAAAPVKFDGMFTTWYFDNFAPEKNPFRHSAEDMNSMYRGHVGRVTAHMSELGLRKRMPHNALEDALIQAREFERVLELMARNRK